ncbi:MAG: hypothetical protein JXA82_03850 [Sedimentisphaerales bacterium]|nr:hypothetical protein [Sedimentisphaerales bacterium]
MGTECELLANCGFFKKFQNTRDLACQGFIKQYCKGPKMDECKRKLFRQKHGSPPPDEMMPTGQTMAA